VHVEALAFDWSGDFEQAHGTRGLLIFWRQLEYSWVPAESEVEGGISNHF